jgi:hypothetical protein
MNFEKINCTGTPTPDRYFMLANTGVPMSVNGYDLPIVIDFEGAQFAGEFTPILYYHDEWEQLGVTTARQIVGVGEQITVKQQAFTGPAIAAKWQFTSTQGNAGAVKEHIDGGFPYQVSVGAIPSDVETVKAGESVIVNGNELQGPIYVARKALITEMSVVVFGADRFTTAIKAQKNPKGDDMPNETNTAPVGKPVENEQATPIQAQAVDTKKIEAELQEQTRVLAIETIANTVAAAGTVGEIELEGGICFKSIEAAENFAKATKTVTADAFKKALLEAARKRPVGPVAPMHHATKETTTEVLEAAILKSVAREAQIPLHATQTKDGGEFYGLEAWFDEKTLEAADAPHLRNPSLGMIYAELIKQVYGFNEFANTKSNEFWDRATSAYQQARFGNIQAAGGSPISLDSVWLNVARKILLSSAQSVPTTYQHWCKIVNVSDFKPVPLITVDLDGTLAPVGNNGVLEHGRMGDSSFTVQTQTFGKMYGITRKERINDDMNAYLSKFATIGQTVPKTVNQLAYYTLLKGASTYFTAAKGNYLQGAGTAFSQEALQQAIALYDNKVGFDGQPILATPDRVIVGTSLKYIAERLYKKENPVLPYATKNSTEIRYQMMDNEVVGELRPIVSPYLNNTAIKQSIFKDDSTSFPNQENTQYFVACDPNSPEGAAFYIPCLNGNINPHVEAYDFGPGMLGTGVQIYADFNVVPGKTELMTRVLGKAE